MWSVKCHTFVLISSAHHHPMVENWETGCLNKCKAVFKQFLKVLKGDSFVHTMTYYECLSITRVRNNLKVILDKKNYSENLQSCNFKAIK